MTSSEMIRQVTETTKLQKSTDEEGNKCINQYVVVAPLGQGAYGKVKLAAHISTEKPYAIKIMNKSLLGRVKKGDHSAMEDVQREIAIMKAIHHRNCVQLFEIIDDSAQDKLYLVMEYVEGGPLANLTPDGKLDRAAFSEDRLRDVACDIISGLHYLHQQNIIHRDIKPENILVDALGCTKLTDFGVSQPISNGNDEVEGGEGTPAFQSPEICGGQKILGFSSDVWAFGVTLYSLCRGRLPFYGNNVQEISKQIINDEPDYTGISPDLKDLLQRLLCKEPKQRITLEACAAHKFFVSHGKKVEFETSSVVVSANDLSNAIVRGKNIQLQEKFVLLAKLKSKTAVWRSVAHKQSDRTSDEPPTPPAK